MGIDLYCDNLSIPYRNSIAVDWVTAGLTYLNACAAEGTDEKKEDDVETPRAGLKALVTENIPVEEYTLEEITKMVNDAIQAAANELQRWIHTSTIVLSYAPPPQTGPVETMTRTTVSAEPKNLDALRRVGLYGIYVFVGDHKCGSNDCFTVGETIDMLDTYTLLRKYGKLDMPDDSKKDWDNPGNWAKSVIALFEYAISKRKRIFID